MLLVGLRTVGVVVGRVVAPVVTGVVLVERVARVLRGVVVLDGLFAGLLAGLLVGRLVLPPPIVPPPAAGSCWAIALAHANRQTNAVREIRERRHRVDIRFSPAIQTATEVSSGTNELLLGIIVLNAVV